MTGIEKLIERQVHNWDRMRATLGHGVTERHAAEPIPQLPVLTFSREAGAGARSVARVLAERMGLEMVGYSLIDEVARDLHVQKRVADTLDERVRNAIDLLLSGLMRGRLVDMDEFTLAEMRTMRTVAARGGVIFIGRGANYVLREKADLSVRFVASPETRIRRLMAYENLDHDAAHDRMVELDRERARYVQRVFQKDIADPTHYDLVIGMDRLAPESAADVVAAMLHAVKSGVGGG